MRAEYKPETQSTINTPYLAPTGELWCVFREKFGENYNGTTLYLKAKCQTAVSPACKQWSYWSYMNPWREEVFPMTVTKRRIIMSLLTKKRLDHNSCLRSTNYATSYIVPFYSSDLIICITVNSLHIFVRYRILVT